MTTFWAESSLVLLLTVYPWRSQDFFGFALANFFVGETLMRISFFTSRFGCDCLFYRFVCRPQILKKEIIIG